MLEGEYKKAAKEITTLGFKGNFFDLEVKITLPQQIIEDENKFIEEILESNRMNLTGRLFKVGVQVTNAGRVIKAGQKQIENIRRKKLCSWRQKS